MADRVFPVIQPEHYPAFQKLVSGLAPSYDVWSARHVEELRGVMRQGHRPIEVVVFPDAFAEFLHERRAVGSLMTLEAFAIEKALRWSR